MSEDVLFSGEHFSIVKPKNGSDEDVVLKTASISALSQIEQLKFGN